MRCPGIDDGPADMAGSLALLASAVEEGITALAATPHLRADHPEVRPEELGERVRDLAVAAADAGLRIELIAGGEVDLHWAHQADAETLRSVSFGQRGHDLLVETPYGALPERFEDMLFQLSARDYRLLLAHPERNQTFQRDRRPPRVAGRARHAPPGHGLRAGVDPARVALAAAGARPRARGARARDRLRRARRPRPAPRPARRRRGGRADRAPARPLDGHRRARGDRGRRAAAAAPAGARSARPLAAPRALLRVSPGAASRPRAPRP